MIPARTVSTAESIDPSFLFSKTESCLLSGLSIRISMMLFTALALGTTLQAQLPTPNPPIDRLLVALGSPSFREREKASRELVSLGLDILPDLARNRQHDDREVRERVVNAIQEIRDAWKPKLIEQFEQGAAVDPRIPFPGWKRLEEIAGDSPDSRQLMARMLTTDWDFLESTESNAQLGRLINNRCMELHRNRAQSGSVGSVGIETISAILLAACSLPPATHNDPRTTAMLCTTLNLYTSSNTQAKTILIEPSPFRLLVEHFLEAPCHPSQLTRKLQFATEYQYPASATLARQLLEVPGCVPNQRQFAILALGKYGAIEDLPVVLTMFDDETLVFRHRASKGGVVQCQIRDAALATALALSSQPSEPFGIPLPSSRESLVEISHLVGFRSDLDRKQAFERWTELEKTLTNDHPEPKK